MRTIPKADFRAVVLLALAAIAFPTAAFAAGEYDWPNWRGPEQNNISRETGIVDKWNPKGGPGSNLLWKSEKLGTRSTPIAMNGKLYVVCRADPLTPVEGEKVICADAVTGEVLWENKFNVALSDVPGERVGWANLCGDPETGNVYCNGVSGLFLCIDGKTGKTIWSNPTTETFGMLTTYGARTHTPIIFEDLVIVSGIIIGWGEQARPNHRFIAFNKKTGEVVWYAGTRDLPNDTNYSGPVTSVLNGQAALVVGGGDGAVWAIQPRTGKPIWHYDFTMGGINPSPLVVGDTVYAAHSEENLDSNTAGGIAAIKGDLTGDVSKTGEIWRLREYMVGRSSPVMFNDLLYCIDDRAKLFVLDPKNGEVLGRRALGKEMRATPLVADGKMYCATSNGQYYVLKPDGNQVKVLSQGRLPTGEECHGSAIVSNGRIYLPSMEHLYCIGTPDHKPALAERPAAPQEKPVDEDDKPAHVQIVPAELLLRPGDSRQLTVKLYNSRGQLLKSEKVDATFKLDGPGRISPDGKFTAVPEGAHKATYIHAKVGDLDGLARVRVVPNLPWKFDFSDHQVPITWVSARYRHITRAVDGNDVMVKVTTIPKGTRSMCFFGQPDLHDYTIQADVLGNIKDNKMPDIGVIAQGYILDIRGASQELQLRTWGAQMRVGETIKFPWKPNVWHTIKLRASVEDGKAVVRGKVWPREEKEPADWTVTLTDPQPVATGSPGLFGNATDAEIFLDNITVTPNSAG
ncbi:MAG: serine/threonine protein kinase [Planctomycetota bacterium]|nr:MAG: serine/threonine protein kinase [Planctomycetota bacterium]